MEDRTIEYLEGKRARESKGINAFSKEYLEEMRRQEAMLKATVGLTTEELERLTPDLCRAAPKLLEALKNLPNPKSILAEAAYTGGDIPKKWINDRGNYINGYNQALKEIRDNTTEHTIYDIANEALAEPKEEK